MSQLTSEAPDPRSSINQIHCAVLVAMRKLRVSYHMRRPIAAQTGKNEAKFQDYQGSKARVSWLIRLNNRSLGIASKERLEVPHCTTLSMAELLNY